MIGFLLGMVYFYITQYLFCRESRLDQIIRTHALLLNIGILNDLAEKHFETINSENRQSNSHIYKVDKMDNALQRKQI